MPELDENDLRKLFQAAGHDVPGTDLTERIMARVAVTPIARPVAVEPLIGKRAWAGIITGVSVLLGLSVAAGQGAGATAPYLAPLMDLLGGIGLPQGDWPLWMIGASACALLFALLDRALARRTTARAAHA